ncbi:MAG: hypothetical protein J2P17_00115 [Mycobacterium sp.]|nr:hypothetical protein [Mycobacterium sp.]
MTVFRIAGAVAAATVLAASVAGCGRDHGAAAVSPPPVDLRAEPGGITWADYHGIKLPTSTDGPRENGDAATGFTHTPAGAALAAIVHTVHISIAPPQSWPAVARAELAPAGKDDLVTSHTLLAVNSAADPATAPRIRGYTITSWTSARAQIGIYTSFPDQSIAVNTATVVWENRDWLLAVPNPSSTDPVVRSTDRMDAAVRLEAPQ